MIPEFITSPDPSIYLTDNWICIDYETTNIDYGDPRNKGNSLVYAGWCVGASHPQYKKWGSTIQGHFGNEFDQGELAQAVEQADVFVAQNTKFELGWTQRLGVPLQSILPYDTIIGEYQRAGNRRFKLNLTSIAERYGMEPKESIVDSLIKSGVCPSQITKSWLARYCKKDVELTRDIFLLQRRRLHSLGLLPVTYTANLFTPVLVDIENNGMFLDAEKVQETYDRYVTEQGKVDRELQQFAEGVNFASPLQLAHFIYEDMKFAELKDRGGKPIRNKPSKQFPEGTPKTDKGTLAALKASSPKQEKLVELLKEKSRLDQAISTYLSKFKDAVQTNGGHLYGRFNQTITQTHRLSSSGPNFQNFDRFFKPLFTTRDSETLIGERDAAQLEFRVAAYLGDDAVAKQDVANGYDVHSYTASIIFRDEWVDRQTTDEIRTASKEHTFKPLYGGRSGTDREQEYYRAFREKYHDLTSVQDSWVDHALCAGEHVNVTGLKWFWNNVRVTKSGYVEGNTNVRNYPIQYLATGEIVPIGVTYVWHHMKAEGLKSLLVNTVHDSMITEEYPEETERLDEITREAFSEHTPKYMQEIYGFLFDVPLDIETELATHWGLH